MTSLGRGHVPPTKSRPKPAPVRAAAAPSDHATAPPLEWLALAAAALLLAALSLRQLWPTDLGWQIAMGRVVLSSGPPHAEPLSWLAAGRPLVEPRWLWCAGVALVYDRLGPAALSWVIFALLVAAFAIASLVRAPRHAPALAGAVLLAAALTASQRLVARPDVVSAVMFAVFLALLDRDRRRRDRWIFALVPLQALWANTHTLFGLGVALAALRTLAAFAGAWRRGGHEGRDPPLRAALLTVALAAACALNPYGFEVFRFAFRLAGELQSQLVEAYAYELLGPFSVRGGYVATAWFVALAAAGLALAAWRRRALDPFLALVWLFTLALALTAIRNLLWFALASLPFACSLLESGGARRPANRRARVLAVTIAVMVAGFALYETWRVTTDRFFVAQHDTGRFGAGLTPHRYPETIARATVAWLGAERGWAGPAASATPIADRRPPRVYATPHEASWLLTSGIPSGIDPRLESFTSSEALTHLAMQNDSALVRREVDRLQVSAIVCGLESTHLLRVLAGLEGWRLLALDDVAALFVRGPALDPAAARAQVDSLARALRTQLPRHSSPVAPQLARRVESARPWQVAGNALAVLGRPDLARGFLEDAIHLDPHSTPARLALAAAMEASDDDQAAKAQRATAVRLAPRDPDALSALGLQQLESGEVAAARGVLEQSVRRNPKHARSWALLGEARAMAGDVEGAVAGLETAVRLAPENSQYRTRLEAMRVHRSTRARSH